MAKRRARSAEVQAGFHAAGRAGPALMKQVLRHRWHESAASPRQTEAAAVAALYSLSRPCAMGSALGDLDGSNDADEVW